MGLQAPCSPTSETTSRDGVCRCLPDSLFSAVEAQKHEGGITGASRLGARNRQSAGGGQRAAGAGERDGNAMEARLGHTPPSIASCWRDMTPVELSWRFTFSQHGHRRGTIVRHREPGPPFSLCPTWLALKPGGQLHPTIYGRGEAPF